MTTVLAFWFALGIVTIALAIYRKMLAKGEDTYIHLEHGGASLIENHSALAGKLATIDKWGKTMTIITVCLGLAIGGVYVYEALRAVPL